MSLFPRSAASFIIFNCFSMFCACRYSFESFHSMGFICKIFVKTLYLENNFTELSPINLIKMASFLPFKKLSTYFCHIHFFIMSSSSSSWFSFSFKIFSAIFNLVASVIRLPNNENTTHSSFK